MSKEQRQTLFLGEIEMLSLILTPLTLEKNFSELETASGPPAANLPKIDSVLNFFGSYHHQFRKPEEPPKLAISGLIKLDRITGIYQRKYQTLNSTSTLSFQL